MVRLKKRWYTPRVEFGYLNCVDCRSRIDAPHCPKVLMEITESIKIEEDLKTKTLERAKFGGFDKYEWRLNDPKDYYFGKL